METIDLQMCGERGLISSFLIDLSKKPVSSLIDFLSNTIEFKIPLRLNPNNIKKIGIIIEPDLGKQGFGSPDAIIVLHWTTGERKVFIVEAKLSSFEKSCTVNDRIEKGYNSTLKGQLELNYCLSLALSKFKQSDSQLVEPDWIKGTPYVEERKSKPSLKSQVRYLKKNSILKDIVPELSGISLNNYYHIVVTKEDENPLIGNKAFHPDIYTEQHCSESQWHKVNNQFGWINYKKMKTYIESSSESLFLKTYKRLNSLIFWPLVALLLSFNAYSQNAQQNIKELYETHKNTIGFYRACGSPSSFEDQQSSFTYYLEKLNNVKNMNLIWRDYKREMDVDDYAQFFTQDEMRIIYLDLAKRFKQIEIVAFQDDFSLGEYDKVDKVNGSQTYKLMKKVMDSVVVPMYESPVYYCSKQYIPSPNNSSTTDVLIDKLSFVASVAPSKFKPYYLAQIKALQVTETTQAKVSLTKEEEAKLTKLKSLISIYENDWGVAILDYEKLHLLAKEYGHDIPLKVCKYYTDSFIQLFTMNGARMLSELNSKVTKIIKGEMPIIRLGL